MIPAMEEENDHEEQVKPFAPLSLHPRSDVEADHENPSVESKDPYNPKCIICCGFIIAVLLIVAVTFIVLACTIFHIQKPKVTLESAAFIQRPELRNETQAGRNLTLVVEVSVKNPNVASFRFGNAVTSIGYGGVVIGEGRSPPGRIPARRTVQVNVTIDIANQDFFQVPSLPEDSRRGELNISSYIRVSGQVKILKIFKKSIVVKVDCSMKYNISSHAVQDERCWKHKGI